ncbi:hypothetical protein GY45DRAFT_90599 [Cubamyces sp. BRFM 1775]|nr:hypothetical protein GY45DRAFT_90599 [Cubamyces sp. BRFM 1775]
MSLLGRLRAGWRALCSSTRTADLVWEMRDLGPGVLDCKGGGRGLGGGTSVDGGGGGGREQEEVWTGREGMGKVFISAGPTACAGGHSIRTRARSGRGQLQLGAASSTWARSTARWRQQVQTTVLVLAQTSAQYPSSILSVPWPTRASGEKCGVIDRFSRP